MLISHQLGNANMCSHDPWDRKQKHGLGKTRMDRKTKHQVNRYPEQDILLPSFLGSVAAVNVNNKISWFLSHRASGGMTREHFVASTKAM